MTTTAEPEPVPEISVPVGSVGENVTDSKYNDTEITPLPESSPTVTFNEANITEALDNSTEYVIVKGEPEPEMKNTTVVQTTTMPSYENVTADVSGNITKMDVATNISGLIDAEIEEATGIPEVVDNATMEHSKGTNIREPITVVYIVTFDAADDVFQSRLLFPFDALDDVCGKLKQLRSKLQLNKDLSYVVNFKNIPTELCYWYQI